LKKFIKNEGRSVWLDKVYDLEVVRSDFQLCSSEDEREKQGKEVDCTNYIKN